MAEPSPEERDPLLDQDAERRLRAGPVAAQWGAASERMAARDDGAVGYGDGRLRHEDLAAPETVWAERSAAAADTTPPPPAPPTPTLNPLPARGGEDSPIALDIQAWLSGGPDTGELTHLRITGLPDGATLRAGDTILTPDDAGNILLPIAERDNLIFTPPPEAAGTFTLTVTALARGADGTEAESAPETLAIEVSATADIPTWITTEAGAATPSGFPLHLLAASSDTDGSETLSYLIAGLPDGATLTEGAYRGDGIWALNAGEATNASVILPEGFTGRVALSVTAITLEANGETSARAATTLSFVVAPPDEPTPEPLPVVPPPIPRAETPSLDVAATAGTSHDGTDQGRVWIALDINAGLTDTDGAERLGVVIRDLPEGFALSAGSPMGAGVWLLDPTDLDNLAVRPPAGYAGSLTLRVEAIATETTGQRATRSADLSLDITLPEANVTPSGADPDARPVGSTAPAPTHRTQGITRVARTGEKQLRGDDDNDTRTGSGRDTRQRGEDDDDTLSDRDDDTRGRGRDDHDDDDDHRGASSAGRTRVYGGDGNDTLIFASTRELRTTRSARGDDGIDTARMLDGVHTLVDADFGSLSTLERLELRASTSISLTIGSEFAIAFGDAPIIEAVSTTGLTLNGAAMGRSLTVLTGAGADRLTTGAGHDRIDAGAGNDIIASGAGNDTIIGGAGSDRIDGGAGVDTLVYAGNRAAYVIEALSADPEGYQYRITSAGGVDLVRNVERIDFADSRGNAPSGLTVQSRPDSDLARAPTLSVSADRGVEDGAVALTITARGADANGAEMTIGVRVEGVPDGAMLSAGTYDATTGTWLLSASDLDGLRLIPAPDFSGSLALTVRAIGADATGHTEVASAPLRVTIAPVADGVTIRAQPDIGHEDGTLAPRLTLDARDRDGSETITAVTIADLPAGASLTGAGARSLGNGQWSVDPDRLDELRLNPPPDFAGDLALRVMVTTRDGTVESQVTDTMTVRVSVTPDADTPILSGDATRGPEDSLISLHLDARLGDTDGSEILSVVVTGLPDGALLSAGRFDGEGGWVLRADELDGLTLRPPPDWTGVMDLSVTAWAVERAGGDTAATRMELSVTVTGTDDAPTLDWRPAETATIGDETAELAAGIEIDDRDGEGLSGARVTLSDARGGDRLAIDGHSLARNGDQAELADSGIVVTRVSASEFAFSGIAPAAAYEQALGRLVLVSDDPAGLPAGTRVVSLDVTDAQGTAAPTARLAVTVEDDGPTRNGLDGVVETNLAWTDTIDGEPGSGNDAGDWTSLVDDDGQGGGGDAATVLREPAIGVDSGANDGDIDSWYRFDW
jgi:Ca2+-binding RTX toxin-like protein